MEVQEFPDRVKALGLQAILDLLCFFLLEVGGKWGTCRGGEGRKKFRTYKEGMDYKASLQDMQAG